MKLDPFKLRGSSRANGMTQEPAAAVRTPERPH